MALNAWQKLTWVLPGQPFGDGVDGDYSSATAPTMSYKGLSGTNSAGATVINIASSGYANGDVLKIVQTRGTNAGQWEFVRIASGGGTTALTITKPLQNTYTDSGANQSQAIKVPRYRDVVAQAGNWTPSSAWNQDVGGELIFACSRLFTPTATLHANGTNASTASIGLGGTRPGESGYGFKGGDGFSAYANLQSNQGEGTAGAGSASQAANGNGPGGAYAGQSFSTSGSGASHATLGTAGTGGATVGSTSGSSDLVLMTFGGGGGPAAQGANNTYIMASAPSGGGCITIIAKRMTAPTAIQSKGGNAADGDFNLDSGAAAGGSLLLMVGIADIGTDKLSVIGGATAGNGGAAGHGRIAVYFGISLIGSISGSLYGSYTSAADVGLIEPAGGAFLLFV